MRILLWTHASLEDPTYAAVLGGLSRAYRRLGHEVTLHGQGAPSVPHGSFDKAERACGRLLDGMRFDLAHGHVGGGARLR
jgi:hypothetical protein